jgi:hypothetical protein
MVNEQFTLYGLAPATELKDKIHSAYMLQTTSKSPTTNYTIMPFLIIRNDLTH